MNRLRIKSDSNKTTDMQKKLFILLENIEMFIINKFCTNKTDI